MSITVQHRRDSRANIEAVTPADGELGWDQTLKAARMGDGSTLGGFLMKKWRTSFPVSPPQITADQNNYNPTDLAVAETLLLTADASRSITGITAAVAGARMSIVNRGSFDITLKDASASSTAANRFQFGADVVLKANGAIELQYSGTDSRWIRANGAAKLNSIPEELIFNGVITPAQITADRNDYAPVDTVTATKTLALASIVRLSTDASRNITGLVDPRDGVIKTLLNVGTNPVVLLNQNAGSSAANRFDFGANITLAAKQSAKIRYDATDSRWKLEAATSGAAVAAGAVTAQTLGASALGMSMINGTLVASVAGSSLTVAIKNLAGNDPSAADPVYVLMRNAAAAAGDFTVMTLTAAVSLVISSGSSLGVAANNTAFKIWVVGFNDGGTFRLGVVNCLVGTSIFPLSGLGIASSTAEGGAGAADAAWTFYTGAAVTAKAYATLAYMTWETGLASAGTWSAGPTRMQLFGHGVPLPGHQVTCVVQSTGSVASGSTLIPIDNTIPQNTEGDQYLSAIIIPSSAAHLVEVESHLQIANSAANPALTAALFQDSAANALASTIISSATNALEVLRLAYIGLMGLSVPTTFKVRAGSASAGTTTFNGSGGAPLMSGTLYSFLRVREVAT